MYIFKLNCRLRYIFKQRGPTEICRQEKRAVSTYLHAQRADTEISSGKVGSLRYLQAKRAGSGISTSKKDSLRDIFKQRGQFQWIFFQAKTANLKEFISTEICEGESLGIESTFKRI